MEALFSAIQSAIALKARQGWILFLFGSAMLACFHFRILPASEVLPGLYLFFAAITLLGIIILMVSLGSVIIGRMAEHDALANNQKKIEAEYERANRNAVQNLEVLNEVEEAALAWILRNGQQRFRAEFARHDGNNLQAKQIIYQLLSDPHDAYRVNAAVWEMRTDILAKLSKYPERVRPPWQDWA